MIDRIFDFGQYLNRLKPVQEIEEKREFDSFEIMKVKAILKEEIKPDKADELSNEEVIKPTISTSKVVKKRQDKIQPQNFCFFNRK